MQTTQSKNIQIWLPTLLAVVLVIGLFLGTQLHSVSPASSSDTDAGMIITALGEGKIEELLRYIEAKYVDDVNRDKLVESAINSILEQLDPHSNYISKEQLQAVNEQLEGNFEGIGVEFLILDDTITVVSPLAGGPSEAVGVLAGDKIVEIEDSLVVGEDIDTEDVVQKLRGEKGSEVTIGILRGNTNTIKEFTIVRDKIPMNSIDIAYMLDDETGYIKINRFSATTYEEFMQGLEKLVEEKGMKNLIIDVRHNPGGYLQQATNLLSQLFTEKGKLLVYTEGRTVKRTDYKTTGRNFFDIGKIAVLIDEGSASASEILAGAIQDLDRGIIVGRRSFGKGLVQEQYNLRDGSALRLTVARYYTPSGRSIQKPYTDLEGYDHDVVDRYKSGELYSSENIHIQDTTKYYTENGRVVYGGGGIIPDIFVPLDTVLLNDYYAELRQHIPQFIFPYAEAHKASFPNKLENFVNKFQVPETMWNDFLAFAYKNGAKQNVAELKSIQEGLKLYLKARLARHLFGDEGFYSVWNQKDEVVRRAVDALEKAYPLKLQAEKQ